MFGLFSLIWFLNLPTVSLQSLEFSIEPKSVVVREGNPAILNCQTNRPPNDLVIQWRKGKAPAWILDYINQPYKLLKNNSLYFPSVGKDDEDSYFCGAFLLLGTQTIITKTPAYITLAYIKSNFIEPPPDTTVREHTTATLTCTSGASQPLPSVTWQKNGRPIGNMNSTAQSHLPDWNATSATLQLKNVSLADAGYYTCVAINPLLPNEPRTSQRALLLVLPKDDEPRIEVHPVNRLSPISYPLLMDCVIVGVPSPVIYWIHNGIKVLNTSNTLVYVNGSLYMKSLTLNHRGHYSCNGTNDKGSVASSTIFLGVAFIQYNFVQDPQNKTAVNGSKVELECKPPPHFPAKLSYKWYKDYRVILLDGRTNISSSGSLIFTQVLKSDEGAYLCEATNTFARQIRTSRLGYLTVNVPPYFIFPPSNQTVLLNENLHLTCVFEGSPRPRVLWYHGNTLLSNSSRLYLGADGSLTLIAVRRSDDGVYKCSIKNVAGNGIAEAEVRVHAPPNGTVMPRDASVVLGTNASFSCQFGGNPPPTVSWYFSPSKIEATLLSRDSSHFIQTKGQLHILNVTEQDKGWFTCAGNNIVGSQNFSAYLNVLVPAFLVQSPRNTIVNHSDVAEMTCRGYGNPEPTITWSKDGRLVVSNNKTTFNGSNLQLKNVVRNDSGVYSCTAKNNLGNETSSAYLTVQVPPTIQSVVGPSRVQWRRNVSFQCKVDGVPKPEITWLKVSHPIVYTKRILKKGDDLFITSTGQNDTGNYTCKASNVVGLATTVKQLVVEVPPYRPLNVHIANITSTSIQVLWKSGFDGFSHIISFRLEMRTDSQSWKNISDSITSDNFTIKNLRPYTRYHVRVFARNKIGWSEASENTSIITSQDFPSSPVSLRCRGYNASAVRLAWDQPSQPNGRLGQYRVQYKKIGSLTVEENVTSLNMSRIISGLETFTVYKYRVQASTGTNSSLWGNYSSYVSCRSGEAAPAAAPQNFSLTSVGSDTILARWKVIPSRSENGIVRGYCIQYTKTSEAHYTKINITGNRTLAFNVTGLVAWTEYVMQVSAVTVERGPWGEARSSRTFESEPSGSPTNILIKANSSSSLWISWRPPLLNESNGLVTGYMVLYGKEIALGLSLNITTNETSVLLTALLIYTSYVVQIRAFTSVGYGPFSDRKIARTFESYPGTVRNVTEAISNDSVLVTWKVPNTPNGIITAYTVHYNTTIEITVRRPGTNLTTTNITTQSQHITTLVTTVILNGIPGNVTYFLCVAAKTSVGYGKCSNAIIFTTNFTLKTTPKPGEKPGVFTPSIVDDHMPLIAGGATIFVVIVIALFTCIMVRRRNRKKEEQQAKQTHNFRGHAFSMDSYDDGQSSMASRGSRPINGYSMESSSIQSRTNGSNIFTSEGHDKSHLVRLRNSSLNLGSDASSYDDPYSSVVEIGVDPLTVNPLYAPSPQLVTGHSQVHSAHNPLYAEVSLHGTASAGNSDSGSINSHVAVNPLYSSTTFPPKQPSHSVVAPRAENTGEKHAGMPPDQIPRADPTSAVSDGCSESSMEGNEYFSSDDDKGSPPHPHEVLVLPPPPPEFSDFTGGPYEPEAHSGFSNEVTDF